MLDVEVTPRAAIQIEAAATWWVRNRQAAPDAIRVDFREATTLLSRQPGVGAKSSTARYPDLRRLYLSRVRYHIYYHVHAGKVVVVAFWHASRSGPTNLDSPISVISARRGDGIARWNGARDGQEAETESWGGI